MSEQFVKLHTWMTELGLNPSELIVFAVIHGYTASCGEYHGGVEVLGKWTGLRRQHVYPFLKSLVDKGLIRQTRTSGGRHAAAYISLVNRPNIGQFDGRLTVRNRDGKPSEIGTHIDNIDIIDNPPTPLGGGRANADARPERKRRSNSRRNRALNYMHSEHRYTEDDLRKMGISLGEEFYDNNKDYTDSLNELRIE